MDSDRTVKIVVDHVFVCGPAGAPAAALLREFGLTEGSPNQHPGQGTACRRFFFENAMLELLWLADRAEAESEQTRRTRLFERLTRAGASPFGIILRPDKPDGGGARCPFDSWQYRPRAMPALSLEIAANAGLDEPMWCFMANGRAPAEAPLERRQPLDHRVGFRRLTRTRLISPPSLLLAGNNSVTAAMANYGVIELAAGPAHAIVLEFDDARSGRQVTFPDLPITFLW